MRYPKLQELKKKVITQDTWAGYNHNPKIKEGQLYDEINMTADHYPILTPRRPRAIYWDQEPVTGMIAKDALCWTAGRYFYINGMPHDMGLSMLPADNPKKLVGMGAYVIVLPDKKYINTENTSDWGNIEASWSTQGEIQLTLCDMDGNAYTGALASPKAPENPENGKYWIDTGSTPNTLRQWAESEGMWTAVPTCYTKIESTGIGADFGQYDGVELAGWTEEQGKEPAALMGSQIIWSKSNDWIVVTGILTKSLIIQGGLTVSRRMPKLDHVIECKNRLWGCRYGRANNGEIVNEIYCCKLGDFKNWSCFMGISTDSWVGACGSDGAWTGAISFQGMPVFFKADHIHKVFGSMPSSFSIQDTAAPGVEMGSEKSLAQVDSILYYKGRTAVYGFDGSLPHVISENLGDIRYRTAAAGALGQKYYISMQDTAGEWALMIYDKGKGIWSKEDDLQAMQWCSAREHIYCIDTAGRILCPTGDGRPYEDAVEWLAETGEIGLTRSNYRYSSGAPEAKWIRKISVRLQMDVGAEVEILIQYDGRGPWIRAAKMRGSTLRSFTMPILTRRCDWLKLRIRGRGNARIYSISRTMEQGSDWNDADGQMLGGL